MYFETVEYDADTCINISIWKLLKAEGVVFIMEGLPIIYLKPRLGFRFEYYDFFFPL
jgi:hypothetical protein